MTLKKLARSFQKKHTDVVRQELRASQDMLAYSGSNMLCIKTGSFPPHMQKLQGTPPRGGRLEVADLPMLIVDQPKVWGLNLFWPTTSREASCGWTSQTKKVRNFFRNSISQMLHVWNIYLHLGNVWGKCWQIFHTWSIWVFRSKKCRFVTSRKIWSTPPEMMGFCWVLPTL